MLGAAQAGKDQADPSRMKVRAIELGSNMSGQATIFESGGGEIRVGCCLQEIPTKGHEHLSGFLVHGKDRVDGIMAMIPWARDAKFTVEGGEECLRHLFENPHGAIPLYVGVAPNGTEAGTWSADGTE